MAVITAEQAKKITRAIGKELKPLWQTQVFKNAHESAQYLITTAISRALIKLEKDS